MKKFLSYLFLLFIVLLAIPLAAQQSVVLSGFVKDAATGEVLPGATVYSDDLERGVTSNEDGYYVLELPPGNYHLTYSFVGYKDVVESLEVMSAQTLNVALTVSGQSLEGVTVTGERLGQNIKQPVMSVTRLDVASIERIPALMGEVDVIKAIQMLPGIQSTSEGSSGYSVRGGSPDQNLILLDDAAIYNASHMMGFFSVFNSDAVRDIKIYKGDIPAAFGGRLSSLLQVNTREGDMTKFKATGGIGTISSRITVEGPIIKNKMSLIVSARRTYADVFLKLSNDEFLRNSQLHFYDLNGKFTWAINENNKLTISAYSGEDVYGMQFAKMNFGNESFSTRYTHIFSPKLLSDLSFHYSKYKYEMGFPEGEVYSLDWFSDIVDYTGKLKFTWYADSNNTVQFGVSSTWHDILPSRMESAGNESLVSDFSLQREKGLESAVFITNQQDIGSRLSARYGIRYSYFQNVGPATVYDYDADFFPVDSTNYGSGDFYNHYGAFEPRISLNYVVNEFTAVKASYTRTAQYLQLAQNSSSGNPVDVWFMASPNVKPQLADQWAAGVSRNFKEHTFETSLEVYYKAIHNAIDFRDHAELMMNQNLDGEVRTGTAWSYGAEVLVKKVTGKLTGWVAYTLSRSFREIDEINDGEFYPAPYDKPNDVAVILNYDLSKRLSLSANWVYATGSPITFPTGKAIYAGATVRIYNDRNSYRMPDYHRMDLSLALKSKPNNKKWSHTWIFSVYNLYNRHNAWAINFVQDDDNPDVTYAEMTYLFGIIPSITFNFNF